VGNLIIKELNMKWVKIAIVGVGCLLVLVGFVFIGGCVDDEWWVGECVFFGSVFCLGCCWSGLCAV